MLNKLDRKKLGKVLKVNKTTGLINKIKELTAERSELRFYEAYKKERLGSRIKKLKQDLAKEINAAYDKE